MFLKVSHLKASTLCAGSALLVLGGFMSVNLAGCGGGGGGGNSVRPTSTPASQGITFRLTRQDNTTSNGGTVALTGPTTATATANSQGVATIANVKPGTYSVTFTTVDAAGAVSSSTTVQVTITRAAGQTFVLLQDGISVGGGFTVRGTVLNNPVGANGEPNDDPDDNPSTPNCGLNTPPVTGTFLVSAIDLDTSKGQPIIAQVRRSAQNSGAYTIFLPYKPAAFRIRIGQYDSSGARFAGESATTNITSGTSVDRVDVCANIDGTIPNPNATATPIVTPRPTFTPTGTGTATTTATVTPTGTVTVTPTGTVTVTPTGTVTVTPTGTVTVTPTGTVTVTPTQGR